MALVGYARVSSVGQSLEVQLEKLKHCDKIYQEQRSATGKRPRLAACLEYVREGDTLVVTRLNRLALNAAPLPNRGGAAAEARPFAGARSAD
jgi:DNA invertase Pin-like site-specific DNA recombinase